MRAVPAQLYVGPAGSFFQPGLGNFQRALFVSQSFLQGLNQHLSLEDLLQSLGWGKQQENNKPLSHGK